jgi:rhamnogalacturonan endolyase
MEDLDRGVVAVPVNDGVYVGWRMFGHEYDAAEPARVTYGLYRDGARIAEVTDSTNYLDREGGASSAYSVRAVIDGVEGAPSADVTPWSANYLSIPLQAPASGYSANDGSAGDLDGDGVYEIILKWDPDNAKDNSQAGVTGNVYLDALKLDGTRLWRIDLGPNIRAGAHYTQFIVFDYDGDGKAELAVKTAPGTKEGSGAYLKLGPAANDDDSEVYRNGEGYVLSGPEYLSVFSGETGAELATVAFDQARGNVDAWGDDYGNRVDRFLATAAYLDDTGRPSFVMARGYYTRTTLTAWNFRDGELTRLWKFDSDATPRDDQNNSYTGQGAHSLSVANVDDDPEQEIVYGAMAIDHDGSGLCSTGYNHGDALHAGDFIPSRPGVEVFMPNEDGDHPAYHVRDGGTCEILNEGPTNGNDTGRAAAGDVDPENPGAELWASGGIGLTSATTNQGLGSAPSSINFLIWWDADESRELEDGTTISKHGGGSLLNCSSCSSNNGTKSTPTLTADLLGDWREEIIWREANNSALRLYTTTAVTARRIYTLMHDPQYRVAVSWQNVAYNQPPHPSFHIGNGMAAPPAPSLHLR